MEQLPTETSSRAHDPKPERWRLMRDVGVFQVKLLLDGLRDLIFGPLSILAAAVGLLSRDGKPRDLYDKLMAFGDKFDRWVNLFGVEKPDQGSAPEHDDAQHSVDAYFQRLERVLRKQYAKGGLTRTAKERIDEILDAMQQDDRTSDDSECKKQAL